MMKAKSIHIAISIALLSMTFVSCNEETLYDGPCKVRFVAEVQDEVNVTRATDEYTALPYSADFNAGLYVSYGTTAQHYTMKWVKWGDEYKLSANLWLETGDYNFYGYAPQQDGTSFDNTNKILTIPNIPGLSEKDLIVTKPCSTTVISDDISTGTKTVHLQMDHMMAKITPCFYLNSTYAELRGIRIKKVEFFFDSAPTYTATVNYTTSPHTIGYEPSQIPQACNVEAYDVAEPTDNLPITKDNDADTQVYQECGYCYIVPAQSAANLKMTVTYDVYDKAGVCTRQNATATNQIKKLTSLVAGKNYKLNIQIIPTYLYVLSDNDESSVLVISK